MLGVEEKWTAMREAMLEGAKEVCGMRREPPRHKETWWWNEKTEKAIKEKRKWYKLWNKCKVEGENEERRVKYVKARQKAKKEVAKAIKQQSEEFAREVELDEEEERGVGEEEYGIGSRGSKRG